MRYIAFDIGIKNFAFIVMHFDEETKETNVQTMHNCNLIRNKKDSVKNLIMDSKFFSNFHSIMKEFHDIFHVCDICLMERQLFSKQNYKACTIYHHLYAHLCIFFPTIKIIGFPSKRKYFLPETLNQNYTFRKKWGIQFMTNYMNHQNDEIGLELLNTFPKKDDIADCFLIIYAYIYH